jgi:hypothetical protein
MLYSNTILHMNKWSRPGVSILRIYLTGQIIWRITHTLGSKDECKYAPALNYAPHKEAVWGSGRIILSILNLSSTLRWAVSFMPWPLYPQENRTWYLTDRRLGGSQTRLDVVGGKQSLPLLGSNIVQPCSLVTVLTGLSLWCWKTAKR